MSQVHPFFRPSLVQPVHPSGSPMKPLAAAVRAALAQQQHEASEAKLAMLRDGWKGPSR